MANLPFFILRNSAHVLFYGKLINRISIMSAMKLYVGGLSFKTTEDSLRDLFSQSGTVESVKIISDRDSGRSKGFGFVSMLDGADQAVESLNGREFEGRRLVVNEARPQAPRENRYSDFRRESSRF
jgi:RNA recognition motif-containing protein